MKYTITVLSALLLQSFASFAQMTESTTSFCTGSTAVEYLHGNDVRAVFRNGGDMFWDGVTATSNVPYNSNGNQINTMFAGALWMGAYDQGGNLMLAAQTYRNNGDDYFAGPLDPSIGQVSTSECANWDHIWKAPGAVVNAHIADLQDNGIIDNVVDDFLLKWPARGNPYFLGLMGWDIRIYNQDLAPFYDHNGDFMYNPYHGDFPIADVNYPNIIADDLLWTVFNDNGALHSQTGGLALTVEVQLTAYAFNCSGDDLINRTIFTRHKIMNRNPLPWNGHHLGLWTDFDLGCSNDDFVGSIPALNTVYAYNSDNDDNVNCGASGITGYGNNPPVQAMTYLNQTMSRSSTWFNGGPDEPSSALDHYRLLTGHIGNGNPSLTGNYNPNNTMHQHFVFPDNPNNASGWSMHTDNAPGTDTRILSSINRATTLPGETIQLVSAYSYHRGAGNNNLQNVDLMYQQIPLVQNFYNNGYDNGRCNFSNTLATPIIRGAEHLLQVSPNPAQEDVMVKLEGQHITSIELYSLLGQSILQQQNIHQESVQLSIADLPQGIYVLQVRSEDKVWSEKIRVQH